VTTAGTTIRFVLVSACALAIGVYALFFWNPGLAVNVARGRTFTARVTGDRGVSQSFAPGADGLSGITVAAIVSATAAPRGSVQFNLFETDALQGDRLVLSTQVLLERMAASAEYRLPVPPQGRSGLKRYRLDVRAEGLVPGDDAGLLATVDDTYPDGRLFVDGREQWGDLVFSAEATRASVAGMFDHHVRQVFPDGGRWPVVAISVLWSLGLLVLLYVVIVRSESHGTGGTSPS
jgi:hypothetical protein